MRLALQRNDAPTDHSDRANRLTIRTSWQRRHLCPFVRSDLQLLARAAHFPARIRARIRRIEGAADHRQRAVVRNHPRVLAGLPHLRQRLPAVRRDVKHLHILARRPFGVLALLLFASDDHNSPAAESAERWAAALEAPDLLVRLLQRATLPAAADDEDNGGESDGSAGGTVTCGCLPRSKNRCKHGSVVSNQGRGAPCGIQFHSTLFHAVRMFFWTGMQFCHKDELRSSQYFLMWMDSVCGR